jgi:pimeloyl-ACP methyl ester carboxylesterase
MSGKVSLSTKRPPAASRGSVRDNLLQVLVASSITLFLIGCLHYQVRIDHVRLDSAEDVPLTEKFYTDWDDIPTSEKLKWVPCFRYQREEFLCARLTVPMDYSRPLNESSDNPEVHIAMVMLPGPSHGLATGRFSESPLLLNPGGPGGQGTEFVLATSAAIQLITGGVHDVIGFDPRGIGATVPQADCFLQGDPANYAYRNRALMHRSTFEVMGHDSGLPNSSSDALGKYAVRVKAFAKMCREKVGQEESFGYLGTPNVARDMKTIVEAWDQWMEDGKFVVDSPIITESKPGNAQISRDTKGKLVYWGFSYGTLLGVTYAAMFRESTSYRSLHT